MAFKKGNISWNKNKTYEELYGDRTEEIKRKMKRVGWKHTEETKQKIRLALLGKTFSEEHRENLRKNHADFKRENNPMWGKPFPEEARKKIALANSGANNPRWKDGTKISNGYVNKRMDVGRYRGEHRIIAEKALGRKLKKNEIVHHVNGDSSDNRNCNLLICDRGYHSWLHHKMSQLYMEEHFGG